MSENQQPNAEDSGEIIEFVEVVEIIEEVEVPAADTAAIDAAIARAAEPVAEPAPVSAGLPEVAAAVAAATATEQAGNWAAPVQPEVAAVAPAPGTAEVTPQPVYVQAPVPPKPKGSRWFNIMIAAVGAIGFAALYAGAVYVYLSVIAQARLFTSWLVSPVFWGVVVAFFVWYAVLGIIINRGPWWTHAVFGWLVAILTYFSTVGILLGVGQVWTMTTTEFREYFLLQWLSPFALIAVVFAREIPIWIGGWAARHGRAVTARNHAAMEAYDAEVAAGPVFY